MKIVIPFSILLLLVGLLSGCVREEMGSRAGAGRVFNVPYLIDAPQTRVAATGAEREVKDVAIFFYNAGDGSPDQETYVDCQAITVPEGSGSSGSFPLPLPATIIPGMKYKLLIIGNYNKYRPEGKSLTEYAQQYNTRTYTKMKQEMQGQLATDGARITAPLPFWGKLVGKDGSETTLTGPSVTATQLDVSVKFSRAVARIDVSNLVADRLRIAWVKVCNYRSRGYLFHEFMAAGDIVRGTSAVAPGATLPPGYVQAPPPGGTPGSLIQNLNMGGLYAFHNSLSYTSQNDRQSTCLMIAGYYQDPTETTPNTTKLTYYRANVNESGSSQFLRRNYIYTLTINSVSREGSDTEEMAMNATDNLLGYVVGDNWESGEGHTETDENGNYLTLTRTSVTLDSDAGASEIIGVEVKEGATWKIKWKENTANAFRAEKANDNSIGIFTTGKNATKSMFNATLTVSVTGLSTPLEQTVSLMQLPADNDPQILTVDGKLGAFDYPVPGQGAEISLQVITGSPASQWKAEADNDLIQYVSTYTQNGVNKGYINLSFIGNAGTPRQGTLTVKRLLAGGSEDTSVPPVAVTFKQGKSPYIISLVPNYAATGLTIDAFQPDRGSANGIAKAVVFNVQLTDPVNYKYEATCSFNKNSDAFISKEFEGLKTTAGPVQTSKSAPSSIEGVNGESIYLNVFRTGPGDKTIRGSLVVKAVPIDPNSGLPEASFSTPITIETSCKIGDSRLAINSAGYKPVLWADRNVGTISRGDGGAMAGLNYSNDENSDDHLNNGFKGGYYSFTEVANRCATFGTDNRYEGDLATGWRAPDLNALTYLTQHLYYSKQRAYVLSEDKTDGTVGCWFPLSGSATSPNEVKGYFWTGEVNNSGMGYYTTVDTKTSLTSPTSTTNKALGFSARCVRDINPVVPTSGDL